MSILDGLPTTEAEMEQGIRIAGPIIEKFMAALELTERQRSAIELMKEGLSLADILGFTKEQRDAMLVQGCRFMQLGEIQKARDTLTVLYQLEPLDERTIYGLATTYQLEGDFATAGKMFVQFLALDATNPEGFLRLGECFLGAKEYDNALDAFDNALRLAKKANDPRSAAHAEKMLGIVRDRRAATAS